MDDVSKLLSVLQKLTDNGNTVVVIEHNLDCIKVSDYIIDLGPNGGNNGGEVYAYYKLSENDTALVIVDKGIAIARENSFL